MTEFGFIDHIKELFAALPDNGFEGIGDDCAVLPVGEGESLVFTTDMLAEGVHFLRPATSPRELGRKSLAVNLSDVASMGARPVGTLLSLSPATRYSSPENSDFRAPGCATSSPGATTPPPPQPTATRSPKWPKASGSAHAPKYTP